MKNIKKTVLITALTASAVLGTAVLTGCNAGGAETTVTSETTEATIESEETTASETSSEATVESTKTESESESTSQSETAAEESAFGYTEDQAMEAIMNYVTENFAPEGSEGDAPTYIEIISNDGKEAVILYRSYTAAQTYFHIELATGETYITEIVPGIIDEETANGVTFNIKEYLG